mmetsp:Transcript_2589/g.5652  ORF Transcript_2589/g.5652 Transcript_2589/m.5652 type:complete len:511 (-) Transcript_2589:59-1591(-)
MPFIIGISAAAAAYHLVRSHRKKRSSVEDGSGSRKRIKFDKSLLKGLTSVDLLPMEKGMLTLENPIQTISFYDGNSSDAARLLWSRLSEVVKANPWLSGWLVSDDSMNYDPEYDDENDLRLWYNESGSSFHPGLFQYFPVGLILISRDTPYTNYEESMEEFHVAVKPNGEIINNVSESIFRVSVIPEHCESGDLKGFALVVSMSHVVGDGYTYYKIYNMLLGAPVMALDPRRNSNFVPDVEKLMGVQEANYAKHMTTDPSWEKFFWWGDHADDDTKVHGRLFEISDDWLNNYKSAKLARERRMNRKPLHTNEFRSYGSDLIIYNEENDIVKCISTNDIITSWFWNIFQPSVGMMAINLRGRVDSATDSLAGNYHNSIAYTLSDYSSPDLIQRSLNKCRRAGVDFDPPTILPRARLSTSFSVVTNWTSFHKSSSESEQAGVKDLFRGSFTLVRHMPLFYPLRLREVLPQRTSFLVVFSSSPKKMGCFLIAPSDAISKIESCGIMNEVFSRF